jgi:hypothetical protein
LQYTSLNSTLIDKFTVNDTNPQIGVEATESSRKKLLAHLHMENASQKL